MKAIRVHEFGGPEAMRLEEVPDLKPSREQVLIHIHAAGVNPVDTYIRSGTYAFKPALPYTPGSDATGVVEAVGETASGFTVGDRVYVTGSSSGTYAEWALCDESQIHPLPQNASYAQGAAMGVPYGTAYRALFHIGEALPADIVLVHGASGGVGTAAVQLARAAGMKVIGTAGTERGRKLVLEQGAQAALDHSKPGYLEELSALTGGHGVDVVLEMLSNVNLGRDLQLLARNGRVVVIGSRGTVEINPRDLMVRDASIRGMVLPNTSAHEMTSIHAALVAGLRAGTLNPVIGREIKLADAPEAHRIVMAPGAYGKIVLVP